MLMWIYVEFPHEIISSLSENSYNLKINNLKINSYQKIMHNKLMFSV